MGFVCAICSEKLERAPGRNPGDPPIPNGPGTSKLATTPCGHVFHTFCINKWTGGGMANSHACPCCRKPIPQRTCLPLFPDSYDENSMMDQSSSQPTVDSDMFNAMKEGYDKQIQVLKSQLQAQREETNEQATLYELQCEEYHRMKQKFEAEQLRSESFHVKWKRYEDYKDMYQVQLERANRLETDLETYKHIQAHLDLSKIEAEQDVKIYSKYSLEEAIRKISGTKNMLQREIENLNVKREHDRNEYRRLNREIASMRVRLTAASDKETELKTVIENLKDEVKRLRTKIPSQRKDDKKETNTNASACKVSNHPSLEKMAKTTTISSRSRKSLGLNGTILISDSDDESEKEIDEDVGIMPRTSKLSRKAAKMPQQSSYTSTSTSHPNKRTALPSSTSAAKVAKAMESFLDDSDILCGDSEEEGSPFHSRFDMKIKSSIPGVPPITPHGSSSGQSMGQKKFTFKKPKSTLRMPNGINGS